MPQAQLVGNDPPPFRATLLQANTGIALAQHRDPPFERRAEIANRRDIQLGTPMLYPSLTHLQHRALPRNLALRASPPPSGALPAQRVSRVAWTPRTS